MGAGGGIGEGCVMDEKTNTDRRGAAVIGAILIVVGIAGLIVSWSGLDVDTWIGESGWPIFVIIPGIVLWVLAFVPRAPAGVGFAIAGSIVTSVGLLLWYQEVTDHWESWSYAWALVGPCAAGVGMLLYGLLTRTSNLISSGAWLAGIFLVVFLAGGWFFESIYETGRVPVDLGGVWPIILIVIGVGMIAATLLRHGPTGGGEHHVSGGAH
jgi:hypothetical protein